MVRYIDLNGGLGLDPHQQHGHPGVRVSEGEMKRGWLADTIGGSQQEDRRGDTERTGNETLYT